jgi:hypothetical protein
MVEQRPAAIEDPASVIRCVECGGVAGGSAAGWKAYIGGGFDGEPLEVITYCPSCALRECGAPSE